MHIIVKGEGSWRCLDFPLLPHLPLVNFTFECFFKMTTSWILWHVVSYAVSISMWEGLFINYTWQLACSTTQDKIIHCVMYMHVTFKFSRISTQKKINKMEEDKKEFLKFHHFLSALVWFDFMQNKFLRRFLSFVFLSIIFDLLLRRIKPNDNW